MIANLKKNPLVSVCIPAFQSQAFIDSAIYSALAQTVNDIEIIVSNDEGHPTPALDPFRDNPRLRIYEQSRRLGWVGNTNFVLSRARGEYFMVLPHDDLLRPRYLEACLALLDADPSVFAVCSDIGTKTGEKSASQVVGSLEQRIKHVFRNLFSGFSYRALMRRRSSDWPFLRLRPNPPVHFCADSTWMLQQACLGELRKVPLPLYWKRYHPQSAHKGWRNLSEEQLRASWRNHCRQMHQIAAAWLGDTPLLNALTLQRLDARLVPETPAYLKNAMPVAAPGNALPLTTTA